MPTDEEILQTGEVPEAQAAAESDTGEPQETPIETPAAGEPIQDAAQQGQLDALKEERAKRQAAEQQLQQYQQMLIQQQAMQQAVAPQQPRPQEPDVLQRYGIDPNDLYTEDGVRKIFGGIDNLVKQRMDAVRQEFQTQQFHTQHSDFNTLVGSQGPMGFQYAEPMKRALQDNPGLEQELLSITDPIVQRQSAYRYAQMTKRLIDAEAGSSTSRDIAATVQARTAPMSPAAVGGGGAFKAAREVGEMSDAEFERQDRAAASG